MFSLYSGTERFEIFTLYYFDFFVVDRKRTYQYITGKQSSGFIWMRLTNTM